MLELALPHLSSNKNVDKNCSPENQQRMPRNIEDELRQKKRSCLTPHEWNKIVLESKFSVPIQTHAWPNHEHSLVHEFIDKVGV